MSRPSVENSIVLGLNLIELECEFIAYNRCYRGLYPSFILDIFTYFDANVKIITLCNLSTPVLHTNELSLRQLEVLLVESRVWLKARNHCSEEIRIVALLLQFNYK